MPYCYADTAYVFKRWVGTVRAAHHRGVGRDLRHSPGSKAGLDAGRNIVIELDVE